MIKKWNIIIIILIVLGVWIVYYVATPFLFNPCRGVKTPKTSEIRKTVTMSEIQSLEQRLRQDVVELAVNIGERNVFRPNQLHRAADFIRNTWKKQGYKVSTQTYKVRGIPSENLWVELKGSDLPEEIILIGAHYDSVIGSPGANDNGSAVAALLELSRAFSKMAKPRRTLRFAAFVNEEPPFFLTNQMGSQVYAREAAKKKEKISAMISLETIGYYTDKPRSQAYPPLLSAFYPNKGNFIAAVGNIASRRLVKKFTGYFKASSDFPCECLAAPQILPGVNWSDHASFWKYGYPAIMITDTAIYRYPHYHQATDEADKINYPEYAKVVYGLTKAIGRVANEG